MGTTPDRGEDPALIPTECFNGGNGGRLDVSSLSYSGMFELPTLGDELSGASMGWAAEQTPGPCTPRPSERPLVIAPPAEVRNLLHMLVCSCLREWHRVAKEATWSRDWRGPRRAWLGLVQAQECLVARSSARPRLRMAFQAWRQLPRRAALGRAQPAIGVASWRTSSVETGGLLGSGHSSAKRSWGSRSERSSDRLGAIEAAISLRDRAGLSAAVTGKYFMQWRCVLFARRSSRHRLLDAALPQHGAYLDRALDPAAGVLQPLQSLGSGPRQRRPAAPRGTILWRCQRRASLVEYMTKWRCAVRTRALDTVMARLGQVAVAVQHEAAVARHELHSLGKECLQVRDARDSARKELQQQGLRDGHQLPVEHNAGCLPGFVADVRIAGCRGPEQHLVIAHGARTASACRSLVLWAWRSQVQRRCILRVVLAKAVVTRVLQINSWTFNTWKAGVVRRHRIKRMEHFSQAQRPGVDTLLAWAVLRAWESAWQEVRATMAAFSLTISGAGRLETGGRLGGRPGGHPAVHPAG